MTRSARDGCLLLSVVLEGRCRIRHTRSKRRTVRGFRDYRPSVVLVSVGVPIVSNLRTAEEVHLGKKALPVVTLATGTCSDSHSGTFRTKYSSCVTGPVVTPTLHRVVGGCFNRWVLYPTKLFPYSTNVSLRVRRAFCRVSIRRRRVMKGVGRFILCKLNERRTTVGSPRMRYKLRRGGGGVGQRTFAASGRRSVRKGRRGRNSQNCQPSRCTVKGVLGARSSVA